VIVEQNAQSNLISIVIPVFNEVESLRELHQKITEVFQNTDYSIELFFVDDGSRDGSYEVELQLAQEHPNISVIRFPVNQGKAAALNEGFAAAKGEYIATIDADLQDDPQAILPMIELSKNEKYDLVSGWKQKRQDRFIKKSTSRVFNFTSRLLTGIRLHDMNNGLKVYRAVVVKSLDLYGELHRFIPVLAKIEGFTSGELKVRHFPRKYGVTKYGASRFYKGFLDLLTVLFTAKFLRRPMHFFGLWGIISVSIGLLAEIYLLIIKFACHEPFQRHVALLLFGVLLIVFGMQFFSLGLIGEMIAHYYKPKTK
jgi:glycosyltransferase involved in cell wall biosynthesis